MNEVIERERERVQRLLENGVREIESEGGNIRLFSASWLSAALALFAEVEGAENLESCTSQLCQRLLVNAGQAGRC